MRWQHFKDSWRKSVKPFDTLTGKLAVPISMVAGLVLTHCVTENWGNYMTWCALGIPGFVLLIYFVWNLVNFHHKIHKDRTPALITVLIFISVTLTILFFAEHFKIARLRNQNSPPDKQAGVESVNVWSNKYEALLRQQESEKQMSDQKERQQQKQQMDELQASLTESKKLYLLTI